MDIRERFALRVSHVAFLLALGAVAGCAQAPTPEPVLLMPRSIVDLSPTITRDMPARTIGVKAVKAFGGPLEREFKVHVTEDPYYLSVAEYTIGNHAGPHYDPPGHVIKGARTVEQAPLEKFFGKARLLDFRSKPRGEPLLKSDFDGTGIEPGDIVLALVGYEAPTDPDAFPTYAYLSGEAAEYLAGLSVKAFATDMPSLGSIARYFALIEEGTTGSENVFPEHHAFASRDVPIIEGLVNLESLVGEKEIVFVGFPLKFEKSDGGPMRAAALVY